MTDEERKKSIQAKIEQSKVKVAQEQEKLKNLDASILSKFLAKKWKIIDN